MTVSNGQIYRKCEAILKALYGQNAQFRDGQYEAIEATLLHHRTLVVQRTDWGKSLVYFVCTKLLREAGAGVTMLLDTGVDLHSYQPTAADI